MASKKGSKKRAGGNQEQDVFVLSVTSVNHGNHHIPESSVVGVYSSKAAAAAASGSVDMEYGTFDSAIESMFEDDHEDNRENPPDNGCLLQIGSEDTGEGDMVVLNINKFPLLGMPIETSQKSNKKKRARKAPPKAPHSDSESDEGPFIVF